MPQYLLRHYSIDGQRRQVHVFDKTTCTRRVQAITDTAVERDFYAIEIQGGLVSFESALQKIEDMGATAIGSIVNRPMPPVIAPELIPRLAVVAALQLLRTKLQRTTPGDVMRQLQDQAAKAGIDLGAEINDADARRLSLSLLLDSENAAQAFASKSVIVLEASPPGFWLSDNPVVLYNSFPYGETGLVSPGVEIYFPISPERVVAFLCPSIGKQIRESLDPRHPRPRLKDPMYAEMLRAIETRGTLAVSPEYVTFVNELQVWQSARFLYSSSGDFDLAERVLTRHPQYASVDSRWTVGEMGRAPPPLNAMPAGEWLVVESGTNHHAVPISLCGDGRGWPLEFNVIDPINFMLAEADGPFERARLYRDGSLAHGMTDVRFEYDPPFGATPVRLLHTDAGLNQLMARITHGPPVGNEPMKE